MADLEEQTTIVVDERPLSVRRKRRHANIGSSPLPRPNTNTHSVISQHNGISTPPQTPKQSKKRVRFSDPGPELQIPSSPSSSSGLTLFIHRTSLSTPSSKRRHSTPATLCNRAGYDVTPFSGTLQFAPLRQVLDGRVKRRLRRNRLSEEINTIEFDKKLETKERKSEVERLRAELAEKDIEVQSLRDEQDIASQIEGEFGITPTSNTTSSATVQELERQIRDLKAELERKESFETEEADWTLAARDPFDFNGDDNMITNYDEDFRDSMMDDEMATTPIRLNTSFPSPPSTTPNTPCKSNSSMNAGIQAALPDPENQLLKSQLESLQSEISKLNAAIELKDDHQSRLAEKLSDFIPSDESQDHTSLDLALDKILTELVLSQTHALEKSHAFSDLTHEISTLGFPSSNPEETLSAIASQFRQARLDLEYLAPGEVAEGFENAKLLDMLISRMKVFVEKIKAQDDTIDQYHEQELLLRQQLNTRVSSMDSLKAELILANTVVHDLRLEITEQETSNTRLQSALESYRAEVQSLESLVQNLDRKSEEKKTQYRSEMQEAASRLQDEILKHDTTRADNESKDLTLTELERRLSHALETSANLQSQLDSLTESTSNTIAEQEFQITSLQNSMQTQTQAQGQALALRDARVSELRTEIDRINEALKIAHESILRLRNENQVLGGRVEEEKSRGESVVRCISEQIFRAVEMGRGFVDGSETGDSLPVVGGGTFGGAAKGDEIEAEEERQPVVVVRRGGFFDPSLARKRSLGGNGKKRRRYDSGLGFLEEEGDGVEVEVEERRNRLGSTDLEAGVEEAVERAFAMF